MYDELDRAAQAGDADKAGRVFADMRERFPRTAFTAQGALLADIAVHELDAQKQRMADYEVQARFALASIYDRASEAPRAAPAATPAAPAADAAAADAPAPASPGAPQ